MFRFNLKNQEVNKLYSRTERTYYPESLSITIEGDLLSLHGNKGKYYFEDSPLLVIIDFVEDQVVFAKIPVEIDDIISHVSN